MKRPTVNSRDARALALGAAIVVPALLYVGAIAPAWRALQGRRQALSAAEDTLTEERRLMMQMPTLEKRHKETVAWLANEGRRLFEGEDDIAATSGLAQYATAAANQAGVAIRETETRPSIAVSGGLRAIRLDMHVDGDTRAVMAFLKQLEAGNRLVRIGRLIVTRGGAMAATQSPGPFGVTPSSVGPSALPTSSRRPLSVSAELYGYAFIPTPDSLRSTTPKQGAMYQPIGNAVVEPVDITDALNHDPFSADRGAAVSSPSTHVVTTPPPFPIKLVGTAVDKNGSGFAVCQLGDEPAFIVHQGEQIAGYTLRSVDRGSIVLADAGGKLVHLTIPTPEA